MGLRADVDRHVLQRIAVEPQVPDVVAAGATGPVLGRVVDGPDGELLREVTFVWRAAPRRWPLLFVNGFTDRTDPGQSLMHHAGGGVWWRTTLLPHDAVVSYRFIDCDPDETLPDWRTLHRRGRADRDAKLPRVPHFAGGESSVLAMPDAPEWTRWPAWGPDPARWCPEDLGAGRRGRVRLAEGEPRALLVLFDGEVWGRLPVGATLPQDIDVVTVATGGIEERHADLTDPERAARLVERAVAAWGRSRGLMPTPPTIVAGQSLGGLAAASVLAARPDLVRGAIAQSPSLWFRPGDSASGPAARDRLDDSIPAYVVPAGGAGRGVVVQVGTHEGRAMAERAERYASEMRSAGAEVDYLAVRGGHDLAWWFPGLLRAVDTLVG
ncbi:DUF3327 domain-containing protein [Tsukamurella sp. 8F]|uniref:enterochelin esterase domain-containing protein n=1 Tax=unclassified Tsukamurella TaxID=2633480 RepID=UPI0023B9F6BA|nr:MULTISPECIES: enterochelin esterase domain-containing protein [unclassified Tsukamurella]MDF0531638.1 DUF3327 domain-containing protein [Tsukamurella sp. 8J]MDF0588794.1 DUF3327 domain-containing protein [Tsukamurella sp. 8F]